MRNIRCAPGKEIEISSSPDGDLMYTLECGNGHGYISRNWCEKCDQCNSDTTIIMDSHRVPRPNGYKRLELLS